MTIESPPLKQAALVALKWNYLGMGVRTGCGLVIGIVMARLLGPKPFGEVAIAALVIGLGNLMADFGFGAALIQPDEISDDEIRFAFSIQVLLGAGLSMAGFWASGLIAQVFHQPIVTPVLRVLMLTFVLQSLGTTASSLLRRKLAFRAMQTAQVSSYVVGYLAFGVPLAYLGYGVWALVAAQVVQTTLNAGLLYNAVRHPVKPLLSLRRHTILSFGGSVTGSNLVNWTIFNLDTAVAGRCFGALELGLYNRAFVFATSPVNNGVTGLLQVLFPGTARAQNEPHKLKRVYLGSLSIIALATVPLYSAMAVAATTILMALYGKQWVGAAPLLSAFSMAMPLYATMAVAGPFLWGMGRVKSELRAELIVLIAAVVAFTTSYRISMVGLAWAVVGIYLLRFILVSRALCQVLAISWSEILCAVRNPVLLGLIVAAVVWSIDVSFEHIGTGAVSRLGAEILCGVLIVLAALAFDSRALVGGEGEWLLSSMRGSLPRFLHRFLPSLQPAAGTAE